MIERGGVSRWDRIYSESQDVSKPEGLAVWLQELCVTKEGALVWFGTQCSSFLLLCKSVSQRDAGNGWLGDEQKPFVRQGNKVKVDDYTMGLLGVCYLAEGPSGRLPGVSGGGWDWGCVMFRPFVQSRHIGRSKGPTQSKITFTWSTYVPSPRILPHFLFFCRGSWIAGRYWNNRCSLVFRRSVRFATFFLSSARSKQ